METGRDIPKEFVIDSFLSAAECNAQQEMSLPMLAQRLIDIATAHANALGVGYSDLVADNNAWVLSRLSVQIDRMPSINSNYRMTTWVEDINRHFSERVVEVCDENGTPIAHGRMLWVAINIDTRRPADLTPYLKNIRPAERHCPFAPQPRLRPIGTPDHISAYQFQFSDIDFNRHVNSTRYIEFMLNQWGVDFFDKHRIAAFEIAYQAEAHYDDVVEVRRKGEGDVQDFELARNGVICTRARFTFAER